MISDKALKEIKALHRANKKLTKEEKDLIQKHAEAQANKQLLGVLSLDPREQSKAVADAIWGESPVSASKLGAAAPGTMVKIPVTKEMRDLAIEKGIYDEEEILPVLGSTDAGYLHMVDTPEERDGWSKAFKILYGDDNGREEEVHRESTEAKD